MTTPPPRSRWVTVFLIVLPLWLFISAGFGLWFLFRKEKKDEIAQQARFALAISQPHLQDDLRKFVDLIGERNTSSETAAFNLTRAASMIEGILGPSNTGYMVKRERGPASHPMIHATLPGKNSAAPVWIIASYDSKPGSPGVEANATGVAAVIASAQALARHQPEHDVHFAFIPHANDAESPVMETLLNLRRLILHSGDRPTILVVEAMGAGEPLWLTSRDTTARPLDHIEGLGSVVGAEVACLGEDSDIASLLFETGLPATRVATRSIVVSDEPDDGPASAEKVAASSGRLVELIRRCSSRQP